MARFARGFAAALIASLVFAGQAHAERVTWRATGVITFVRSYSQPLPLAPRVGDQVKLDMEFENDSANVTGDFGFGGPGTVSYPNIYRAVLTIGSSGMIFTPNTPVEGATTIWNDVTLLSQAYDNYYMHIADAATQWEVAWGAQVAVVPGAGPIVSLNLLSQPPRLTDYTNMTFKLTPADTPSSALPAVEMRLDSVALLGQSASTGGSSGPSSSGASSSSAASSDTGSSGGGAAGLTELLVLLGWTATACYRRRLQPAT